MDGVLVDTEASYTEAVVQASRWLLGERAEGIDRALVRLFKRSGNWNNDWDLTYGLYCWRLSGDVSADQAARATLAQLQQRVPQRPEYGYEDVLGVFEEIYNGTAIATARYGVPARVHVGHGLAEHETIALTPQIVDELTALGVVKFGVVTGRVLADWNQVRARVPLPATIVVSTDEDGRKPDVAPLKRVIDALQPDDFVSVGDTLNDLLMVRAFGRGRPVTLCPIEDEPGYREAGGELFIRALGELPKVVRSLR